MIYELNYECSCGHTWKTFWDKCSKDECRKCGQYVNPKEHVN